MKLKGENEADPHLVVASRQHYSLVFRAASKRSGIGCERTAASAGNSEAWTRTVISGVSLDWAGSSEEPCELWSLWTR